MIFYLFFFDRLQNNKTTDENQWSLISLPTAISLSAISLAAISLPDVC